MKERGQTLIVAGHGAGLHVDRSALIARDGPTHSGQTPMRHVLYRGVHGVERIILLSPAVAPRYDLRPALWATRHEIVSFNSSYDRFILGWGTSRFGTIDRFYGPSAGLKNFIVPASLNESDRALYGRLVQIRWNPRLILEGHTGGHLGTSMPIFLEKEVAPWLK